MWVIFSCFFIAMLCAPFKAYYHIRYLYDIRGVEFKGLLNIKKNVLSKNDRTKIISFNPISLKKVKSKNGNICNLFSLIIILSLIIMFIYILVLIKTDAKL